MENSSLLNKNKSTLDFTNNQIVKKINLIKYLFSTIEEITQKDNNIQNINDFRIYKELNYDFLLKCKKLNYLNQYNTENICSWYSLSTTSK